MDMLSAVIAVADKKAYSAAAGELGGITTDAVQKRVKNVEAIVREKLF